MSAAGKPGESGLSGDGRFLSPLLPYMSITCRGSYFYFVRQVTFYVNHRKMRWESGAGISIWTTNNKSTLVLQRTSNAERSAGRSAQEPLAVSLVLCN